jgi:predicted phosphodiesterase
MRLLHTSDIHFNRTWFNWLRLSAPAYDAVALTGDLIGPAQVLAVEEQIVWIRHWAESFPAPLMLCSGNHDFCEDWVPAPLRYWMRKIRLPMVLTDGQRRRLGDWTFESVAWNELPIIGGTKNIALIHCPPNGSETAISYPENVDWGDLELAGRLLHDDPDFVPHIVLSGHVHRPRRWHDQIGSTLMFNPGVNSGAPWPNHIILNFTTRTAEHRSHGMLADQIQF